MLRYLAKKIHKNTSKEPIREKVERKNINIFKECELEYNMKTFGIFS